MAGEELRQLCSEGGWTYGALWCNDWRDPRMLLLEGSYHEEQSGMIFEKVVNQVHVIGQGTIGEVALSGKHRWINFDAICMESSELSSTHNPVIFQGIAEWQYQILAGIKTIAVIPLPSLGVLQFGSIQKIDESSDFIAQAQHLFWQFRIKQRGCLLADMNFSHPQTTFDSVISSRDYISSEFASLASGPLSLRTQIGSSYQTSSLKSHAFSMPESISSKHQIHNSFMNNPIYSCEQTTDQLNDGLFVPFPYSFPDVPIAFSESPADCVASSLDRNCDRNVSEYRLVSDNDLFDGMEMSSVAGSGKGLLSESRSFEQLLDAVVATKDSVICQDSKCDVEKTMQGPLSEAQSNSNVYTWIDDTRSVNAEGSALHQPKKLEEHTKVVRKRARHGESTRPRPKDRQQIQDRVKELREIVPNGTKCSIDSLLDRTIKHMLFLQSVTKYIDKLKQADEPKLISEKSGVVLKDNTNGVDGATWAYEVDGQTMACPIMVEDVYPSGQMLVEMVCEERGFFLEIADVVRGFGLTILKGDMEIRERKVWARFLVEANRYVTRMDIFLSLVQFMQQASSFQAKELLASTIFSCNIC